MSRQVERQIQNPGPDAKRWGAIIVGAGPAGLRAAECLLRGRPDCPILIYGDEPEAPYQRARLSEFLAGEVAEATLGLGETVLGSPSVVERQGCAVVRIDPKAKTVTDASGRVEAYAALVLATGSIARRLDLPGMSLPGVIAFRGLADARALVSRRLPGHRVVVLGGGALGLETALAMRSGGAAVCVIDHNVRLMAPTLDRHTSRLLRRELESRGIVLALSQGIRAVLGRERVTGVRLSQGQTLDCDILVLAAGVRANTGLAQAAGLQVARGIVVNDRMETSGRGIYAVGECAQHQGKVYRLVAPALEQAAVAAEAVLGREACYPGSVTAVRLKNIDVPLFSLGAVENANRRLLLGNPSYRNAEKGHYRKLILDRGRLEGAVAWGDWPEQGRLQAALKNKTHLTIFQLIRFRFTGQVFGDRRVQVSAGPETAVVCQCLGLTRETLGRAIRGGCGTLEKLAAETGASRMCGSCKPLLANLLGGAEIPPLLPSLNKPVLGISIAAAVAALGVLLVPALPLSATVQGGWKLEGLWLDGFWKQVTGYHLLGLVLLSLLLSARKRLKGFRFGGFGGWRMAHMAMGLLMLGMLALHTGLSLGSHLNFALMASFLSANALGAAAGAAAALEGKMGIEIGGLARRWGNRLHIAVSWPLPVLIVFHMLAVYFF